MKYTRRGSFKTPAQYIPFGDYDKSDANWLEAVKIFGDLFVLLVIVIAVYCAVAFSYILWRD